MLASLPDRRYVGHRESCCARSANWFAASGIREKELEEVFELTCACARLSTLRQARCSTMTLFL